MMFYLVPAAVGYKFLSGLFGLTVRVFQNCLAQHAKIIHDSFGFAGAFFVSKSPQAGCHNSGSIRPKNI